ncbi:MAG TPA: hypothetical protein VIY86_02090 [Pirellulaceae bacterium]
MSLGTTGLNRDVHATSAKRRGSINGLSARRYATNTNQGILAFDFLVREVSAILVLTSIAPLGIARIPRGT